MPTPFSFPSSPFAAGLTYFQKTADVVVFSRYYDVSALLCREREYDSTYASCWTVGVVRDRRKRLPQRNQNHSSHPVVFGAGGTNRRLVGDDKSQSSIRSDINGNDGGGDEHSTPDQFSTVAPPRKLTRFFGRHSRHMQTTTPFGAARTSSRGVVAKTAPRDPPNETERGGVRSGGPQARGTQQSWGG